MATPTSPQPTPQQMAQIQQQIAAEAARRGMTPQQFQEEQRKHIEAEAAKAGMTPQEYVIKQREAFMRQQHQAQQQQAQGQGQGQPPSQQQVQIPVNGGVEPKPEALAVAKFLRSQNLKTRTCILDGQRKDMFKVKRALRALHSDAYKKARTKNALLPEVTNEEQAKRALQLLPLSVLALRVSKGDPHEGHDHAKPKKEKRVKGLWTVKVERQQDFESGMHYVWLYEGSQWKTKLWAGLALIAVFAVVMFPLWPLFMRQGVWYISVGLMVLLGLFFAMALFRLVLFCLTVFTLPPGFWLYPNLFEDVGFFDSFRPLYSWGDIKKPKKKSKTVAVAAEAGAEAKPLAVDTKASPAGAANGSAKGSEVSSTTHSTGLTKRHQAPRVEEVEED